MFEPNSQSLEVAKLGVSILTPLSVALFGWFINRRLREIEQTQWTSRKAIEKRIEIFDRLAPDVNRLYCYFMWIGDWQQVTPPQVIDLKRKLDHGFFVNRYIIGEDVFSAYQALIHMTFRMYVGAGRNALIRTLIDSANGDRRASPYFKWEESWTNYFDKEAPVDKTEVHRAYVTVMRMFKSSIGL